MDAALEKQKKANLLLEEKRERKKVKELKKRLKAFTKRQRMLETKRKKTRCKVQEIKSGTEIKVKTFK